MILEMDIPGLESKDKLACALVARYHSKGLPDAVKNTTNSAELSLKKT